MEEFCRELFENAGLKLKAPPTLTFFDVFVDSETREFRPWKDIVRPFDYDPEASYFEMMVPTVDTTRFSSLFSALMTQVGRSARRRWMMFRLQRALRSCSGMGNGHGAWGGAIPSPKSSVLAAAQGTKSLDRILAFFEQSILVLMVCYPPISYPPPSPPLASQDPDCTSHFFNSAPSAPLLSPPLGKEQASFRHRLDGDREDGHGSEVAGVPGTVGGGRRAERGPDDGQLLCPDILACHAGDRLQQNMAGVSSPCPSPVPVNV